MLTSENETIRATLTTEHEQTKLMAEQALKNMQAEKEALIAKLEAEQVQSGRPPAPSAPAPAPSTTSAQRQHLDPALNTLH